MMAATPIASRAYRRPTSAVFALLDPRREHINHPVVAKCQYQQVLANDTGDDEMPWCAHSAPFFWHPGTAMAQVVMQPAGDPPNARTGGIIKQVFERLKHQALITLARRRTELRLTRLQDVVELPLRRAGE